MKTFSAFIRCVGFAACLARPVAGQTKIEKPDAETLITRLTELDAEGVGLSTGVTGGDFPPVAGQFSFHMGLISPRRPLNESRVLTQLVALGPEAMPALLRHLDDKRVTKLVIEHHFGMGTMWYATEMHAGSESERQAIKDAGIESGQNIPGIDEKNIDKHTITVGDVCFVALGMITNRGYSAVRYQPTACIVINSPVQSPGLAKAVRGIWGPAGEKAGRERFLTWLREDFHRGSTGAATRLLYYFPEETAGEVLEELRKPGRSPYDEQYFLRATAWTPHPGIRAEVQKKVLATDMAQLAESGAAAFGGGKEPADYEKLTKLISRWKANKEGSAAAQSFLNTGLASWPDRREHTLELFFREASRDCMLAGIVSCYTAGPLPVRPLIPLLSRKTGGYGRYLIHGEGVREEPEESDFLDYRFCDNVWEIICRSLGDTKAACTGSRKTMDRQIKELEGRLKNEEAKWPYSAAEIEARQAEQNQMARAKAAAVQEADGKKAGPALRALLILQNDRAGMELWLKSAGRLLHPAAENKDNWSLAVANRGHYKKRLLDELTPEQRETLEKTLTQRALTLLRAVPRAGWPGEDATALVCLCGCVTQDANHPALKAALECQQAALTKKGWPKDHDTGRLLKTLEILLERGTPGSGTLLLRLTETSSPDAVGSFATQEFFSLIAGAQHLPEGAKAAEHCFQNPGSPWLLSKCGYARASEFGSARLLKVSAFRKALAVALSNETETGQLTIREDDKDYCWIEWEGSSSGMGVEKGEAAGVKPGEKMPVRACDALLEGIRNAVFSGYEGPDFHIYWPLEKRNAVRKLWLEYLAKPQ